MENYSYQGGGVCGGGRSTRRLKRVTARVRSRHASSDFGPREQRYGDEGWGGRDRAGGIEAERKGAPGPACN